MAKLEKITKLGINKKNIDELKKELEFKVLRARWNKYLLKIRKNYAKEQKALPKAELDKILESFMINFIYNSDRIEGSKLSYRDTTALFLYGTTPKNKPIKDVKEAEGHKDAFYDMVKFKGKLSLKKILEWGKVNPMKLLDMSLNLSH